MEFDDGAKPVHSRRSFILSCEGPNWRHNVPKVWFASDASRCSDELDIDSKRVCINYRVPCLERAPLGGGSVPRAPPASAAGHSGDLPKRMAPSLLPADNEKLYIHVCRYPGCRKEFASTDGVKKHARKHHAEWLAELINTLGNGTHRCVDGFCQMKRITPRPPTARQAHSAERPRSKQSSKPLQGAVHQKKAKQQQQRGPKLWMDGTRAQPASRTPTSAEKKSCRDERPPSPEWKPLGDRNSALKRPSNRDKGTVRPSFYKARARPAFGAVTDKSIVGPTPRWNAERAAYDVVLPHGSEWSNRQVEWFVSTWWKHLAEASVVTFAESLAHFSAWASDTHGLEACIAWLDNSDGSRADLMTLQLLELLEYAELHADPALPRLTARLEGIKASHTDTLIRTTAGRCLEELSEEGKMGGMHDEDVDGAHAEGIAAAGGS
jgi:hypothetical protein